MTRPGHLYETYAESGFGTYQEPLGSRVLAADFDKNYSDLLPTDRLAPILDIGCGAGHFLYWLKARGYRRVLGVDLSHAAVEHCRRHGLDNVQQVTDLRAILEASAKPFALVVMNDVIEHLRPAELLSMLDGIRRSLASDGRLLVKTLNLGTPGGVYMRYADATHETGFTETSLRQVLLGAGFKRVIVRPYRFHPRSVRRALWLAARRLWSLVLMVILLVELGDDRPRITSKLLLAVADA